MLVLTSKKYEVEETIRGQEENGDVLYEFQMQITPDEMVEIKNILFKDSFALANEEKEELLDKSQELQAKFEDICFKEHKEPFKKKCGEYLYLEMVGEMYDFFMNAFIEKATKRANTINTSLTKIGND